MAYTMEDFNRDYFIKYFALLTPEEQQEVLQKIPPETLLAGISDEQLRGYLARRERDRHAESRKWRAKK
jgi:hypothetical protein